MEAFGHVLGSALGGSFLLASGVHHGAGLAELRSTLRTHGLMPPAIVPLLALGILLAELGLGLLLALDLLVPGGGRGGDAAVALAVLLFLGYGGYSWLLIWRSPGQLCGCLGSTRPATAWTPIRAVLVSMLTALALLGSGSATLWNLDVPVMTGMTAAAAFAAILWKLPDAMSIPDEQTSVGGAGIEL